MRKGSSSVPHKIFLKISLPFKKLKLYTLGKKQAKRGYSGYAAESEPEERTDVNRWLPVLTAELLNNTSYSLLFTSHTFKTGSLIPFLIESSRSVKRVVSSVVCRGADTVVQLAPILIVVETVDYFVY